MNKIEIWPGHAFYRALWPGLLSLIWPGLGHIYVGRWVFGISLYVGELSLEILLMIATRVLPPLPIILALWLLTFIVLRIAIAWDAVRRMRLPRADTARPWYRSTLFAAVVMIAVNVILRFVLPSQSLMAWQGIFIGSDVNSPTLVRKERVLADVRRPVLLSGYGDVVIFSNPRDRGITYTARIVGLSGDRVQLRSGILYINGTAVPREPRDLAITLRGRPRAATLKQYQETLPNGRSYMILESMEVVPKDTEEALVPEDSVFTLQDNRTEPDRYAMGIAPIASVLGVLDTIIWPAPGDSGRLLARVR